MIPSLPNPASPAFWIGLALIGLYFGVDYVGQIPAALAWLWGKVPSLPRIPTAVTPAATEDTDALDLAAFKRLQARYVRLDCKEGQTAMDEAGKHFLHGIGGI